MEVTAAMVLWAAVVGLFLLAGLLTGEWVDKYRELRAWIHTTIDHPGDRGLPSAG